MFKTPTVTTDNTHIKYNFVQKKISFECIETDCILVKESVAQAYIDNVNKKYDEDYTIDSFFDQRYLWAVDRYKNIAESFMKCVFPPMAKRKIEDNDIAYYKPEAKRMFIESLDKSKDYSDCRIFIGLPHYKWTKNYQVFVRSMETQTIYQFSVVAPGRREVYSSILKEFNLTGFGSKKNKGKSFKKFMEENGLDVLSFACDSSRNEQ